MARPRRLEASGVVYHVIARGNERRAVFRDDGDRGRYLALLAHYREKFRFRLLAFCLMDNHVHLAVETGEERLSRIMAGLQSSYTQYFNRRHRRVGHLFQGRYKAFVVDRDAYLAALIRYIHENPTKARVVKRAADYWWSSDRYYRRGTGPKWLDLDDGLRAFGRGRREAVRRYRRLMASEPEVSYEDVEALGQVVKGDDRFARALFRQAAEAEPTPRWLSEKQVASAAATVLGLSLGELRGPARQRDLSRARALAAYVAKRLAGISFDRMGRYLQRDGSTLVRDVGYLEAELKASVALRRLVKAVTAAAKGNS
jgi:REP element-mobilizing transposase RayT